MMKLLSVDFQADFASESGSDYRPRPCVDFIKTQMIPYLADAFVDGNHRFDAVFLDLYYLGHLVRKGGIIILDDYQLPGIARAASFFISNLNWKVEEASSRDEDHHWIVLRTSQNEDKRDFRYFVDF